MSGYTQRNSNYLSLSEPTNPYINKDYKHTYRTPTLTKEVVSGKREDDTEMMGFEVNDRISGIKSKMPDSILPSSIPEDDIHAHVSTACKMLGIKQIDKSIIDDCCGRYDDKNSSKSEDFTYYYSGVLTPDEMGEKSKGDSLVLNVNKEFRMQSVIIDTLNEQKQKEEWMADPDLHKKLIGNAMKRTNLVFDTCAIVYKRTDFPKEVDIKIQGAAVEIPERFENYQITSLMNHPCKKGKSIELSVDNPYSNQDDRNQFFSSIKIKDFDECVEVLDDRDSYFNTRDEIGESLAMFFKAEENNIGRILSSDSFDPEFKRFKVENQDVVRMRETIGVAIDEYKTPMSDGSIELVRLVPGHGRGKWSEGLSSFDVRKNYDFVVGVKYGGYKFV